MSEALERRRRAAMFRSSRRGTKESDLVIGGFAKAHLASLDDGQLARYEALLEQNDPDLLGWIIGLNPAPPEHDHDVLKMMQDFKLSM